MAPNPSHELFANRIDELEKEVSRLRETEKLLSESEEKYRILVDEMDIGITMIDNNYNIIMVNQMISKWFGKPSYELVGKKCYREFEQSEGVCEICPGSKAIATGKKQEGVVQWKKFDGSCFLARNKAFPLFSKNGDIFGFHELIEDITEKQIAEEKLLTEKNFLDSLVKSLPGVMYLFDELGRFLMWNDTFEMITGYSDLEIKKMNPIDFIAPEDKDKVRQAIEKSFKKKQAVVDARLATKAGAEIPFHFTGISFNDNDINYLVGVGIDISDRLKAEKERENLIKKLQEALSKVKLLSGFLPICASCKKIRDDTGYWNQIESYIKEHSEVEFTHAICPACANKLYPDLVDFNDKKNVANKTNSCDDKKI